MSLSDEPGQMIEWQPLPTNAEEPWTGPLPEYSAEEARARRWRRAEIAAWMCVHGRAPAQGHILECE